MAPQPPGIFPGEGGPARPPAEFELRPFPFQAGMPGGTPGPAQKPPLPGGGYLGPPIQAKPPLPGGGYLGPPVPALATHAARQHAAGQIALLHQVAPLVNDQRFHALLNAPGDPLQKHPEVFRHFQLLAQQAGYPDVLSYARALVGQQA